MSKTQDKRPKADRKIVVLVLLFIAGWFYWFQYRPMKIRQDCLQLVNGEKERVGLLSNSQANNYYRGCLAKFGMQPEDLVK